MSVHSRRSHPRPAGPRLFLVSAIAVLAFTGLGAHAHATAPARCGVDLTPVTSCR